MSNTLKTIVEHQGKKLSLEVWADGIDDRDPDNKQYRFGVQVINIPMSAMLRFDAHFIHDTFGDSINLDEIIPTISAMIQNHTEAFLSGRVPEDFCQKWLIEAKEMK